MASFQLQKYDQKDNDITQDQVNQPSLPIQKIVRTDANNISLDDVIDVLPIDKGNYVVIPTDLNTNDADVISCLCISDTHGLHKDIELKFNNLPSADILIHSGDLTKIGHWGDIKSYDNWIKDLLFNRKLFKHCLLIGGNHDIILHSDYYIKNGYNRFHAGNPQKSDMIKYKEKCQNRVKKHSTYLLDESIELFGLNFYGSPWVPYVNGWGFMLKRGNELKQKWSKIPNNCDILITHGPPIYHGDMSFTYDNDLKSNCVGDIELMKKIMEIKPKYHIFGHNHEGYGITMHKGLNTKFINGSTLDRNYQVNNKPVMFYIKGKNNLNDNQNNIKGSDLNK